jgi:hypothetical protein
VDPATADLSEPTTQIQVDVSTAVGHGVPGLPGVLWLGLLLPLALRLRRRRFDLALILACGLLCGLLSGCGSGRLIPGNSTTIAGVSPTPTGTYTLTVTATDSVSLAQHSLQLTLVVQ